MYLYIISSLSDQTGMNSRYSGSGDGLRCTSISRSPIYSAFMCATSEKEQKGSGSSINLSEIVHLENLIRSVAFSPVQERSGMCFPPVNWYSTLVCVPSNNSHQKYPGGTTRRSPASIYCIEAPALIPARLYAGLTMYRVDFDGAVPLGPQSYPKC